MTLNRRLVTPMQPMTAIHNQHRPIRPSAAIFQHTDQVLVPTGCNQNVPCNGTFAEGISASINCNYAGGNNFNLTGSVVSIRTLHRKQPISD